MSSTERELEATKQAAEIEAWKTIRQKHGDAFMEGRRPQGDLSPYQDAVIVDVGSGPRPSVEFFPAAAAFMLDCCMVGYRQEGLLQESSVDSTCCADIMAEKLPLRSNSVDHVIAKNMLDHTHDPDRVADEFYRVLRPGGFVHLSVDIGGEANPCEPVVFEPSDIDAMFEGFELIETTSIDSSNVTRESALERVYLKPTPADVSPLPASHARPYDHWEIAAHRDPSNGKWARYLPYLRCPVTHGPLTECDAGLYSPLLRAVFPVVDGVLSIGPEAAVPVEREEEHPRSLRSQGPVPVSLCNARPRTWHDRTLRIRGTGFGSAPEVHIARQSIPVVSADDHEIICNVEPLIDVLTGAFEVVVTSESGGSALTPERLVLDPRPPRIRSRTPTSGQAGTRLRIEGEKLCTDPAHFGVYVNGLPAKVTAASPDSLECVVPERPEALPRVAEVVVDTAHGSRRIVGGFTYED